MEESTIQSAPLFQLKEDQPLITIRLHADKESLFNWHKKHTFRRRKNTRFTSSCMVNVAQYQFSDFKANITVIFRMAEKGVPGVPVAPPI